MTFASVPVLVQLPLSFSPHFGHFGIFSHCSVGRGALSALQHFIGGTARRYFIGSRTRCRRAPCVRCVGCWHVGVIAKQEMPAAGGVPRRLRSLLITCNYPTVIGSQSARFQACQKKTVLHSPIFRVRKDLSTKTIYPSQFHTGASLKLGGQSVLLGIPILTLRPAAAQSAPAPP